MNSLLNTFKKLSLDASVAIVVNVISVSIAIGSIWYARLADQRSDILETDMKRQNASRSSVEFNTSCFKQGLEYPGISHLLAHPKEYDRVSYALNTAFSCASPPKQIELQMQERAMAMQILETLNGWQQRWEISGLGWKVMNAESSDHLRKELHNPEMFSRTHEQIETQRFMYNPRLRYFLEEERLRYPILYKWVIWWESLDKEGHGGFPAMREAIGLQDPKGPYSTAEEEFSVGRN